MWRNIFFISGCNFLLEADSDNNKIKNEKALKMWKNASSISGCNFPLKAVSDNLR